MIRLHIPLCARCPWREGANLFHLCAWLTRAPWSMPRWLQLGPLLFMCPFNLNAWPLIAARDVDGATVALRGRHGWECFWHSFRVLSHFSMDQCPPHINFTWVRSKSKHARRGYGCLVLESFGTRPLDIRVQSMSKTTYAKQRWSSLYSILNRFTVTQYMAYDIYF